MSHPTAACQRCGIRRTINPSRGDPGLCADCREVVGDLEKRGCGTATAYRRHLYHRELPCVPCLAAHAAYRRALAREKGILPQLPSVCGTNSGYMAHFRRDETPCVACKAAHGVAQREYRARKRNDAAA